MSDPNNPICNLFAHLKEETCGFRCIPVGHGPKSDILGFLPVLWRDGVIVERNGVVFAFGPGQISHCTLEPQVPMPEAPRERIIVARN